MSPANGTVNNKRLHIGVRDEVLVHLCEDPFITPPGKPLVKGVPIAIGGWQKPPLGTATSHPQHSFDESAGCCFVVDIDVGTA